MAHAWYHARSSSERFGGVLEDYLEVHTTLDSTKQVIADARHRVVLHSVDLGIPLCVEMYGREFRRASDGGLVSTRALALRHLQEDFGGFAPTLRDFMRSHSFTRTKAPAPRNRADHLERLAAKVGGQPADYGALFDWFERPGLLMDDPRFAGLLRNAFGVFLAERCFGVLFRRPSDQRVLPTRFVAERLVKLEHGSIPSLYDFLTGMPIGPWFYSRALALSERYAEEGAP